MLDGRTQQGVVLPQRRPPEPHTKNSREVRVDVVCTVASDATVTPVIRALQVDPLTALRHG